jgi:hypothetical protein
VVEREMDTLSDELSDTRTELEHAVGEGWEHAEPTWADRDSRSPERPGPAMEYDRATGMVSERVIEQVIERGGPEIDFGPDLGL